MHDPLNVEVAKVMRENMDEYVSNVIKYREMYATNV